MYNFNIYLIIVLDSWSCIDNYNALCIARVCTHLHACMHARTHARIHARIHGRMTYASMRLLTPTCVQMAGTTEDIMWLHSIAPER